MNVDLTTILVIAGAIIAGVFWTLLRAQIVFGTHSR